MQELEQELRGRAVHLRPAQGYELGYADACDDFGRELATLHAQYIQPMVEALRFAYVRALQTRDQDSELINKLYAALANFEGRKEREDAPDAQ